MPPPGSRPPDYGVERLGDVLTRLLFSRGWGRQQSRQRLQDAWRQAAGLWAERTSLGPLRRQTLEVIVQDAALRQELDFRRGDLLAALARALGDEQIRELRFRVGPIAAPSPSTDEN